MKTIIKFIILLVLFYSTLFFTTNPLMLAILGIAIVIDGFFLMIDACDNP